MQNKKKTFALIRAAAAVAAAVILLACSGFAFVDLLGSPQAVDDGSQLSDGDYVQADLAYIMDICGVEKTESGKEVAYYAIAPIGNEFVVIRFPASEYDSVLVLKGDTLNFLKGQSDSMSFHILVTGKTVETPVSVDRLLTQWFSENAEWMSQSGVIGAVEDYSQYLCAYTIEADRAGSVSYGAAVAMSVIALILVVYAVVELVCILAGVYNKKPGGKGKKAAGEKAAKKAGTPKAPEPVKAPEPPVPEAAEAPQTPEAAAEAPVEAPEAEAAGVEADEGGDA